MQQYRANGKLLLFGEYFVLEGAKSLAVPTRLGQSLTVSSQEFLVPGLSWKSFDDENHLWFEAYFDKNLDIKHSTDISTARTLQTIVLAARELNPGFLSGELYHEAETRLEFPRNWGLGSSSTLIACIAGWAGVDPFELFFASFSGSGYDIACAISNKPVVYELLNKGPVWKETDFVPPFSENMYFVHLGKKQNSREGIQLFRQKSSLWSNKISAISAITQEALVCKSFDEFTRLMDAHEDIVAQALELTKVKEQYFSDFEGSIKSLGAWGGDFILAVTKLHTDTVKKYFQTKGLHTIVPYNEMIVK